MLTPIKKQGDEHIYILLKIGIIYWMSGCYMGICRFVRMLIGSEITYGDALSILYEVHVIGNHADGDKDLLKKSCHEITLPAAKARFAQVLRNSPRAMPLLRYPSTIGCPARHLMMPCQSLPDTRHRSRQIHRPAAQSKLRSSAQDCSACFVPRAHYEIKINRDFTLTPDFTLSPIFETVVSCDKNKKNTAADVLRCFFVGAEGVEPPTLCL